jgi:methylenetetrahydrofolate--tRNA-(uracil-5-)-methyltransferase
MPQSITIIGAGLAGCEAAWQCARRGIKVALYEMRPKRMTQAHQTGDFGELVCSNSLKSESENTAPWLLKQEMRRAGSLLLECADLAAVPAGHALAVDRAEFSRRIAEAVQSEPLIDVRREEVTQIHENSRITIVASGPLTSEALSQEVARLTGSGHLYFYDSISPVVEAESIGPRSTSPPDTTKERLTTSTVHSLRISMTASTTRSSRRNRRKGMNGRSLTTLKAACPLKRSRVVVETRCALGQ